MLEEEGIVVGVKGDFVEVEAQAKAGCGSCSARKGCGTSLVASLFPKRRHRFLARNEAGASTGDRVLIGLDEGALQSASLVLYLLPLLGLIGGALLGGWLARSLASDDSELLSILFGVAGMTLAFAGIRNRWNGARSGRFQAVVLRVLPAPGVTVPLRVKA